MTGYAFLLDFGVISYRSRTQSTTATSSTEAEFIAAVIAAKHAKYLLAVLLEIGYPQDGPMPLPYTTLRRQHVRYQYDQ